MKMKIVKFKDGKYAIRRIDRRTTLLEFLMSAYLFEYKDLDSPYWFGINDLYFKDCKGTKKQCIAEFRKLCNKDDYGEVVED